MAIRSPERGTSAIVAAYASAAHALKASVATRPTSPGWLSAPRSLLMVALTAVYVWRQPQYASVWWATGAMLVFTAAEPVIGRLSPPPQAIQLPGYRNPSVGASAVVVPAAISSLILLAIAAAAGTRPALVGLAAVIHGIIALAALLKGVSAYAGRATAVGKLRSAVASYAPEFAVYTARRGSAYQLRMWVPHLEAVGHRYVVVTRNSAALPELAQVTRAPVIARRTWRDLDDVVVPSLRAAFYVNSVSANADFVTYRQLTHVYLGHGESDKALSHHPAHAMYDRVFVSGTAAIERYERNRVVIPRENFVLVGSPQSVTIQAADSPIRDITAPVVLYAPTWQGYNESSSYSSLPRGLDIVRALLEVSGAVAFRPHPLSLTRRSERGYVDQIQALLSEDARRTGREHRWAVSEPFAAGANRADALVADLSSVVTQFLCSGKPMAIVAIGALDAFASRHPVAQGAYLIEADLSNVKVVLRDLLGDDPLRCERERVRERYVAGVAGGEPADAAFRRAVLGVLGAPAGMSGGQPTSG